MVVVVALAVLAAVVYFDNKVPQAEIELCLALSQLDLADNLKQFLEIHNMAGKTCHFALLKSLFYYKIILAKVGNQFQPPNLTYEYV